LSIGQIPLFAFAPGCYIRSEREEFVRKLICLLVLLLFCVSIYAQIEPKRPALPVAFEVASIKPAQMITPAIVASGKLHVGMSIDAARVDIGFLSLAELIPIAYKVKPYQVSGPDWMNVQRFDIIAKIPEGATKEQVPEMMQALLEERFQLKVHRENRDHNIYALVVSKEGSKLKEAPPDADEPAVDPATPGLPAGAGGNQIKINTGRDGATLVSPQVGTTRVIPSADGTMRMEMSRVSMPAFVEMLSRFVDRPVVDMTDLKGRYQVALDLTMDSLMNMAKAAGVGIGALGSRGEPGRPADASDPAGSSVFRSVQQMGLRLEPRRAPIEFIVVDHVEKMPSEN
jgi:uncharacterized protein (TIGR03435 family)